MSRSRGAGRSCKAVVVEEATAREIIGCEHTRQSNRTIKTRKQKQCVNGKKNFFYWLLPTNQQLNSIQKKHSHYGQYYRSLYQYTPTLYNLGNLLSTYKQNSFS